MKLNLSLGAIAASQLASNVALQLVVLAIVGAGPQTDALIAAQAIPQVVLSVLVVSIQSAWQPRLAVAAGDPVRWRNEQQAAQGQVLVLFGGVSVLLAVSAPAWVHLLFPGFTDPQRALMLELTWPLLASLLFSGHAALLTTAERARGRFVFAEAAALLASLLSIAAVVFTVHEFGIHAAAWTLLARTILVAAVLYMAAGRPVPSPMRGWRQAHVWNQLRPMLAGSSLYKTAPLVDRYWTSLSPPGGMTVFNLGQMAMGSLATVLERSIAMPLTPRLALLVEAGDSRAMIRLYRRCVRNITLATVAAGAGLLLLWPVWTEAAHRLLNLDAPLARQMWLICLLLLGYMHVAASGTVVVAAFCALGEARTPVKIGVPMFLASVALKSAAYLAWGLAGLAAATSTYYIANMAILSWTLEKRVDARSFA